MNKQLKNYQQKKERQKIQSELAKTQFYIYRTKPQKNIHKNEKLTT